MGCAPATPAGGVLASRRRVTPFLQEHQDWRLAVIEAGRASRCPRALGTWASERAHRADDAEVCTSATPFCSAPLEKRDVGGHAHGPAHGLRPRYPFYEKADSCQGQTWRLPRCHALSRLRPGFYPHSGEPMLWARCKLGSVFWGRCNLPHGLGPVPRGSAQSPGRGVRDLRWAAIWPSSCSLLGSYLLCRGWVGLEFGS